MTVPTFVGAGTLAGAGAATLTLSLPTGIAQDDILVLFLETPNQTNTTPPSGWTQIAASPQGTGTAASTTATRIAVYWRRVTATEVALSYAVSAADHHIGVLLAFRGCVEAGDPVNISAGATAAANSTVVSVPGATTTAHECLVVACASDQVDSASTTRYSGWANADLTSVTEVFDGGTTTGNGGGLGVAIGTKAVAGAYGATTATAATNSNFALLSFALVPEPVIAPLSSFPSGSIDTFALDVAGDTITSAEQNRANDALTAVQQALAGPAFHSPASYTANPEKLISDLEATTGWTGVNCSVTTDPDHTTGTKSVRINTVAYCFDNNPTLTTKAYLNLPLDAVRRTRSHIAIDMRWAFTSGATKYQPADFFEFFASSGVDMTGTVVRTAIPTFPGGGGFRTYYIPVRDLTTIRSLGVRSIGYASDVAGASFTLRFDNLRWAAQTELERAMETTGVALVPATYTPSIAQKILDIPTDRGLIDLRSSASIIANDNGVKRVRQFQWLVEDGSIDSRQALNDIFALLDPGDVLEFAPGSRYFVAGDTDSIELRNLRNVTIDGKGARIFTDVNRDVTMVKLTNCKNVAFKGFEVFGSSPRTDLGSAFTSMAGSPSVSGTTIQLDALGEMVRAPMGVPLARDVNHEANVDLVLSDSAQVAGDCVIDMMDKTGPVTAPTAVQTADAYGAIDPGQRYYAYTYRDAEGNETNLSMPVAVTLSTYGKVLVSNIGLATKTIPPPMERVIYRTKAGQTDDPGNFIAVGRLYDNTTTTFLDNKSDGAPTNFLTASVADTGVGNVDLGAHDWAITFINSTTHSESALSPDFLHNDTLTLDGGSALTRNAQVTLSNLPAGPAGTTSRNVYRTKINTSTTEGNFFLVGTIANNTAGVSFIDNVADASLGVAGPHNQPGKSAPIYPRRVLTLTATPTAYRLTVPDSFIMGHDWWPRVYKKTATANTITVASCSSWGRTIWNSNYEAGHAIEVEVGCDGVTFEDLLLEGVGGDGINAATSNVGAITIRNVVSRCVRRQGMDIGVGGPVIIEDCEIREPGRSGIDIEVEFESRFLSQLAIRRTDIYNVVGGHSPIGLSGNAIRLVSIDLSDIRVMGTSGEIGIGNAEQVRAHNIIGPWGDFSVSAPHYQIGYVLCKKLEVQKGRRGPYGGMALNSTGSVIMGPIVLSTLADPSPSVAISIDDPTVPIGQIFYSGRTQPMVQMIPKVLKAGVPTDADFPYQPPDGAEAINTSTNTKYYRKSGVWTVLN